MSTIPTWVAATTKFGANAGMFNQFLGGHNSTILYSGAQVVTQQATGSGIYQSSQSQWISQTFSTSNSQTTIGSINLQLSTVGGSPSLPLIPVLTVGIYADDGSGLLPTGSPLVTALISNNYVYSSPFWVSIPLPLTVTPSTNYHVVTSLAGSTGHYYVWQQSNQIAGAATSPDGVTWTASSFGLMYQILDQTNTGLVTAIYEDSGASLTTLTYNSLKQVSTITQFCTSQGGYITSSGSLSYTNGVLTGVS